MSKPKEYWIFKGEYPGDYNHQPALGFYSSVLCKDDDCEDWGKPDLSHENLTHVIDIKAFEALQAELAKRTIRYAELAKKADELAEAIKLSESAIDDEDMWHMLSQALKEYRDK